MFLGRVVLSWLATAIRSGALAMAQSQDPQVQRTARRCCNLALQSGCWVDGTEELALAHPEMERFCIAFSKVPEKLVKEVGEDTFLKDLFQHYLQVWKGVSEATLRIMLCDLLLWRFLVSGPECNLHLESEFPLKPLLTTIDIRFTDIVGVHSRSNTPFLFVEVGKETVLVNRYHKDFRKLATTLTLACTDLCKKLHETSRDFSFIRMFGMWIGGSKVHFCVAHPFLSDGPKNRKDFSVILSAPSHWAFDLFERKIVTSLPQHTAHSDSRLGAAAADASTQIHITGSPFMQRLLQWQPVTTIDQSQSPPPQPENCSLQCCNFDGPVAVAQFGDRSSYANAVTDADRAELDVIEETPANAPASTDVTASTINNESVAKLKHFCNLVKKVSEQYTLAIAPGSNNNNYNPPDIRWPTGAPRYIVAAAASSLDTTPTHGSDEVTAQQQRYMNAMAVGHSCIFTLEDCTKRWLFKQKRMIPDRKLDTMEKMLGCFLAPTLYNIHNIEADDSYVLELEVFQEITSKYVGCYDFVNARDSLNLKIFEAVACAIHLLCGLYYMHERAGVVHSGISVSTIKYSRSSKLWKLIDYRESMPISESLQTPRTTFYDDYRAPEVQTPGIFTTASDVYSLGKALYFLWFEYFRVALFVDFTGERDAEDLFNLFYPMIVRMKDEEPQNRPTVAEALKFFYDNLIEYGTGFRRFDDFKFKSQQQIFEMVNDIFRREGLKAKFESTRMKSVHEELATIEATLASRGVLSEGAATTGRASLNPELPKSPTKFSTEKDERMPQLTEFVPEPQTGH